MAYRSYKDFLAEMSARGGPSKASRFNVDFGGSNWKALGLTCESASLPGRAFDVAPLRIYGSNIPMPWGTNYSEISMTFIVMNDMLERDLFEAWMRVIQGQDTEGAPTDFAYSQDYKSDITISQYSEAGTPDKPDEPSRIYYTTLVDAFPINVSEMSLNWAQDDINRLTVTFAYSRYKDPVGDVAALNLSAEQALLSDSVTSAVADPMEGPSGSSYEEPPVMKPLSKQRSSLVHSIATLMHMKQTLTVDNLKNLAIGRGLPMILNADNSFKLDEGLSSQFNAIKTTIGFKP